MDDTTKESLVSLFIQLDKTQTCVEQDVFNALNQQDKVSLLFSGSVEKIMKFVLYMESIELQTSRLADDAVNLQKGNKAAPDFYNRLIQFLNDISGQQDLIQEICTSMQNLMENQSVTNEIIHKLEGNISEHRNSVDKLYGIYNKH